MLFCSSYMGVSYRLDLQFLFKRYLDYEKSLGDEERIESVKRKAMEYVETTLAWFLWVSFLLSFQFQLCKHTRIPRCLIWRQCDCQICHTIERKIIVQTASRHVPPESQTEGQLFALYRQSKGINGFIFQILHFVFTLQAKHAIL